MASRYQVLLQERAELVREGETLDTVAEWGDEQTTRANEIGERIKALDGDISSLSIIREAQRNAPASGASDPKPEPAEPPDPEKMPTPFRSLGEQFAAVARAAQTPHAVDRGLLAIQAAALGGSEGVASDGGFLVQTDFESALLAETYQTAILVGKTDRRPISANANGMKMNVVDETSRVDGSRRGGLLAYWTAEAGAFTKSKPTFRQMELTLQKLTGLYYATDEELKDVAALGANITQLGNKPGRFTMALRWGSKGIYLNARFGLAYFLHKPAHLVVQLDEYSLFTVPLGHTLGRRQYAVRQHGLPVQAVHLLHQRPVVIGQITIKVLGLQYDLVHVYSPSICRLPCATSLTMVFPLPGAKKMAAVGPPSGEPGRIAEQRYLRTTCPYEPEPIPTALPSSKSR